MRATRGFTILEVVFAFGLLVIAIGAASLLIGRADHHQRLLWEDAIAGELANSALEHVLAGSKTNPAAGESRAIPFGPAFPGSKAPLLPELEVALSAAAIPGESGILEYRATVKWQAEDGATENGLRKIERAVRRRVSP